MFAGLSLLIRACEANEENVVIRAASAALWYVNYCKLLEAQAALQGAQALSPPIYFVTHLTCM